MTQKPNSAPSAAVPAEDQAFLNEVTQFAKAIYAAAGDSPHSVIMQVSPDILPGAHNSILVMEMPQLGGTQEDKTEALDTIRHFSIRMRSKRCAILSETWMLSGGSEVMEELAQLQARGKGMQDHPKATEGVVIVIESDLGRTNFAMSIDRRHKEMTILEDDGEPVFTPVEEYTDDNARLTYFHVPTSDRITPLVIAWAAYMDQEFGEPRERIQEPGSEPTDGKHLATRH